jgi:aquaporin Z
MFKYLTEFIGSFIFFVVILSSANQAMPAIPIGVALAAAISFGGGISGGHFNPAVSVMMYNNGSLAANDLALYVLVQVLAAFAAVYFVKNANKRM